MQIKIVDDHRFTEAQLARLRPLLQRDLTDLRELPFDVGIVHSQCEPNVIAIDCTEAWG